MLDANRLHVEPRGYLLGLSTRLEKLSALSTLINLVWFPFLPTLTQVLIRRFATLHGSLMSRKGRKNFGVFVVSAFLLFASLPSASALAKSSPACGWDSASGWVHRENAKPGDAKWDRGIPIEYAGDFAGKEKRRRVGGPFAAWLSTPVAATGPEGWFSAPSATCDQSIGLHISGNGSPVTISVFRMGYYGGAGARLIQKIKTAPIAHYSANSPTKPPESMVTAEWPIAWFFKVNQKTLPGQYLIRLDDKTGDSNFVPIMVTNPEARSAVTFISSVLTWQAYNEWGGYSLYKGPNRTRGTRGTVVSLDRPYDGDGAGQFRYMEFPIVRLAEKLGIDMTYITDFELNKNVSALEYTKSIVFGGHSEYWTTAMRDAVDSAVARGVNMVSFGGNAGYNRPRLQAADRQIVMWRGMKADPNRRNPILATTRWRSSPIGRPESMLFGAQYVGLGVNGDYTVAHPLRWPFAVMKHSARFRGVVGREVDSPLYSAGPSVEDLAWSEIKLAGKQITAMATYYTNAKKAGVIDIATNGWACAIDNVCPWYSGHSAETQNDVSLVTEEILKGLTRGPLGLWRPAIIDIPKRSKAMPL